MPFISPLSPTRPGVMVAGRRLLHRWLIWCLVSAGCSHWDFIKIHFPEAKLFCCSLDPFFYLWILWSALGCFTLCNSGKVFYIFHPWNLLKNSQVLCSRVNNCANLCIWRGQRLWCGKPPAEVWHVHEYILLECPLHETWHRTGRPSEASPFSPSLTFYLKCSLSIYKSKQDFSKCQLHKLKLVLGSEVSSLLPPGRVLAIQAQLAKQNCTNALGPQVLQSTSVPACPIL